MGFDLANWVIQRGIDHLDRGPNVARGHINIKCPFCGDDPSYHLGIELSSGAWGCYRNVRHRGRAPHYLIQALAHCSQAEAKRLVEEGSEYLKVGLEVLEAELQGLEEESEEHDRTLHWPGECRKIDSSRMAKPYLRYLQSRGFDQDDLLAVCKRYRLRFANTGVWKQRLLIPVRLEGRMVGWTGRAIGESEIRYRAHPFGKTIKRYLLNEDHARQGGEVLVVVEGPLDTLKLDWYGAPHGVVVVGLMGASWTPAQVARVVRLGERFRRTVALLDPDAESQSIDLESRLRAIGGERYTLTEAEDPGALTPKQASRLARRLAGR